MASTKSSRKTYAFFYFSILIVIFLFIVLAPFSADTKVFYFGMLTAGPLFIGLGVRGVFFRDFPNINIYYPVKFRLKGVYAFVMGVISLIVGLLILFPIFAKIYSLFS